MCMFCSYMESHSIYLYVPKGEELASCLSCPLHAHSDPQAAMGSLECTFPPTFLPLFLLFRNSVWSSQTLLEPPGVDGISYRKPSLLPPVRTHLILRFYLPLLEPFYPSALYFGPLHSCFSPPLDQELIGAQARSDTCCFPLKFPLFR